MFHMHFILLSTLAELRDFTCYSCVVGSSHSSCCRGEHSLVLTTHFRCWLSALFALTVADLVLVLVLVHVLCCEARFVHQNLTVKTSHVEMYLSKCSITGSCYFVALWCRLTHRLSVCPTFSTGRCGQSGPGFSTLHVALAFNLETC